METRKSKAQAFIDEFELTCMFKYLDRKRISCAIQRVLNIVQEGLRYDSYRQFVFDEVKNVEVAKQIRNILTKYYRFELSADGEHRLTMVIDNSDELAIVDIFLASVYYEKY